VWYRLYESSPDDARIKSAAVDVVMAQIKLSSSTEDLFSIEKSMKSAAVEAGKSKTLPPPHVVRAKGLAPPIPTFRK
jgi:hypothetical protein